MNNKTVTLHDKYALNHYIFPRCSCDIIENSLENLSLQSINLFVSLKIRADSLNAIDKKNLTIFFLHL